DSKSSRLEMRPPFLKLRSPSSPLSALGPVPPPAGGAAISVRVAERLLARMPAEYLTVLSQRSSMSGLPTSIGAASEQPAAAIRLVATATDKSRFRDRWSGAMEVLFTRIRVSS